MRTICICLPESPEKTEAARKHFEEAGLESVEFFWGINAEKAGLATWHVYERDTPGSGFKIGTKSTGTWLSHYMLWSALANFGNDEHYMIVETDAKFLDGWRRNLDRALFMIPTNFDFLYPGSCCIEGHPKFDIGGGVFETKHIQCTHCYIVRRAVLPFLLRIMRKIWAPIDIQLQLECFPHLKTYAIVPRIVEQEGTILPP